VYCFGNALHGDDGVGLSIAQTLRQRCAPEEVEVLDLGTDGLMLSHFLADGAETVLVDAWRGDGPTGQVTVHRNVGVFMAEVGDPVSHSADLRFALRAARAELDVLPPVQIVTVTIAKVAMFHIGLSPAVERAVPEAVTEIVRLIREKEDT
jgi:hydrogenase maturation protease